MQTQAFTREQALDAIGQRGSILVELCYAGSEMDFQELWALAAKRDVSVCACFTELVHVDSIAKIEQLLQAPAPMPRCFVLPFRPSDACARTLAQIRQQARARGDSVCCAADYLGASTTLLREH